MAPKCADCWYVGQHSPPRYHPTPLYDMIATGELPTTRAIRGHLPAPRRDSPSQERHLIHACVTVCDVYGAGTHPTRVIGNRSKRSTHEKIRRLPPVRALVLFWVIRVIRGTALGGICRQVMSYFIVGLGCWDMAKTVGTRGPGWCV